MGVGKFANPINQASTVRPAGSHEVRYFDPFGGLIATRYVLTGQNSTAPTPPIIPLLTFAYWNNPGTNITRDEDIGAIYDTTDGKTYIFAEFNSIIGLQPSILLQKSTAALLTINWGDGTTSTSTATGNITFTKATAYIIAGTYTITITCAGAYNLGFGGSNSLFGNLTSYVNAPKKIYTGANIASFNQNVFSDHRNLKFITIASGITGSINSNFIQNGNSLFAINFPNGITDILITSFFNNFSLRYCNINSTFSGSFGSSCFNGATSLECLIIPKNAIGSIPSNFLVNASSCLKVLLSHLMSGALGLSAFSSNRALRSIIIPIGINSLSAACFSNNTAVEEYIFQSAIPPTMANINVFTAIQATCKIYVPDANVNDYKTSTNWITYASYIYPISTRP